MATNTYVELQKTTLTTNTATVEITSIPQGYTDLIVVITAGNSTGSGSAIRSRINGDAGSNYSTTYLDANGTNVVSARDTNNTTIPLGWRVSAGSTIDTNIILHYMNYSNTATFKTVLMRTNNANQGTDANVALWRSSSAINSLSFVIGGFGASTGDFLAGSTFSLYGIKAWSIETTPKATGGYITSDSTYWYHTFLSSSTFTPSVNLTNVEYVVVAGGGGGGENAGSPGGAGGYRSSVIGEMSGGGASAESRVSMNSGTAYTITVGAGGLGNAIDNGGRKRGTQGSSSSIAGTAFSTVSCTGGGYGTTSGFPTPSDGGNGGSGGSGGGGTGYGGGDTSGSGGSGTSGEGYSGGSVSVSGSTLGVGGGGGAGGVGGAATIQSGTQPYLQGNGGIGVYTDLAVQGKVGEAGYLAGGGAGGEIGIPGLGGGGGPGRINYRALSSTGGGGGAGDSGASGVVIIRYTK